jgi:hypothetical protein
MEDTMAAILANLEEGLKVEEDASPISVEIVHISSPDPKRQERGLRELINYSLEEHNREEIFRKDGIPPIVKLLKNGQTPLIRNLAAHAIANMAIYTPAHPLIVSEGGINALAGALGSSDAAVRERALAALCNLCLSDDNIRLAVVRENAIGKIVGSLSSSDDATVHAALMLLANLGVNPAVAGTIGEQGGVPAAARHLNSSDPTKSKYALFVFASLSGNARTHSQIEQHLSSILRSLTSSDPTIEIKVLTLLVNLSGNETAQTIIIQQRAVPEIVRKLDKNEPNVKILATQTIQNLAMTEKGCNAVDVIGAKKVVQMLKAGDSRVVLPAIFAITNLATSANLRRAMVEDGGVAAVQRYENSSDASVREAASRALKNLLI